MRSTSEFFNVQTVQKTLDTLYAHCRLHPRRETVDTRAALGRVLAVGPHSPVDLPSFTRSTMDGYAVRASDTFGASQSLPAYLTCIGIVSMGTAPILAVGPGQAAEIYTGAMLPPGADAVVMIERTQRL